MIQKFRKKPVEIEAVQWDGTNYDEVCGFVGEKLEYSNNKDDLIIATLEDGPKSQAVHYASLGDWIIEGIQGEFYACKPDIFKETYEKI